MKRTDCTPPRFVLSSLLPLAVGVVMALPGPRLLAQDAPIGGATAAPAAASPSTAPTAGSASAPESDRADAATRDIHERTGLLASAKAAEEGDANFDRALDEYRALIADFDRQRPIASEALFRSAEVLQKLGRDKEAQAAYRRVVQEFSDLPEFKTAYSRVLQAFAEEVKSSGSTPAFPASGVNAPGFGLPGEKRPGDQESGLTPERYAPYGSAGRAVESGTRTATDNTPAIRATRAPGYDGGYSPRTLNTLSDRNLSEIQTVQQELDALRGEARDLAALRRRIEREMRATEGANLNTLPIRFIEDPHFLHMLEKLQGAREAAATPGLPSAGKSFSETADALEHLTVEYFKNTYLPRLAKSLSLTSEEFQRLRKEVEQLEAKLEQLQRAYEKRMRF